MRRAELCLPARKRRRVSEFTPYTRAASSIAESTFSPFLIEPRTDSSAQISFASPCERSYAGVARCFAFLQPSAFASKYASAQSRNDLLRVASNARAAFCRTTVKDTEPGVFPARGKFTKLSQ